MPAGSRAYGVSVLALAAALGSGMAVWALPLADLGDAGLAIDLRDPAARVPALRAMSRGACPRRKRFEASTPTRDVPKASSINASAAWCCSPSARSWS